MADGTHRIRPGATGTRFTFPGQPMPAANFSGEIACEVIEVVDGQHLTISWTNPQHPGNPPGGWCRGRCTPREVGRELSCGTAVLTRMTTSSSARGPSSAMGEPGRSHQLGSVLDG